ncbi:MAG: NADP-dependent malic enzyme [Candidatus Komeilibacteria bacterium]|nr:NADP-dependent malic enzyme [Candidatus Komeilibacteria bacterium]
MDNNQQSINLHREWRGKIELRNKVPLATDADLALAYTPGVAAVSSAIAQDSRRSWELTNRANQVAIISDGTAVLGLGDIGPEAAMPVMEGKAAIFKEFAGLDAIPLCLREKDTEAIIKFCRQIEPSFAGINLEDIAAPRCFEILSRLETELSIPVFHDDQDGTAIVVLAALVNALKLTSRQKEEMKVVVNGAGAAGIATTRLLLSYGVSNIIILDSRGIISTERSDLDAAKKDLAVKTNTNKVSGDLAVALEGADVFVGLSKGNLVTAEMVSSMNKGAIIFAMANPTPEIMPDLAKQAGALIVGTGRSDFANQINNALVFPGMFKGLLTYHIKDVTVAMKISVAEAIAAVVEPQHNYLLPKVMDKKVVGAIVEAIAEFKPAAISAPS